MTEQTTTDAGKAPVPATPEAEERSAPARSLTADAWRALRRNPMFWVSGVLILMFLLMATVPGLFTDQDPTYGNLSRARIEPGSEHWFGTDRQGYDVFARTIYGARASILVGVLATVGTLLLGSFLGLLAGYAGGWLDAVISRLGDIFFAIPLLLAGIVLMQVFPSRDVLTVTLVLALFGWPSMARVVRSSVLAVKNNEYVTASRALGLSSGRILLRHVLPNCLAPIIVMATTSLGIYIVAEATLSYLGIGLPPTEVSWGNDISVAQNTLRQSPTTLFYPAGALALTVLGFILLGDVVKDALDPKERKK